MGSNSKKLTFCEKEVPSGNLNSIGYQYTGPEWNITTVKLACAKTTRPE